MLRIELPRNKSCTDCGCAEDNEENADRNTAPRVNIHGERFLLIIP